jgi:hypothetical protein
MLISKVGFTTGKQFIHIDLPISKMTKGDPVQLYESQKTKQKTTVLEEEEK